VADHNGWAASEKAAPLLPFCMFQKRCGNWDISYRRSDHGPRELDGYVGVCTAQSQTRVEDHSWSVYLLAEVHDWIRVHHHASDPAHGRKADFQIVSRRKSCLPVLKNPFVCGTLPGIPRPYEKFIVDTGACNVGIGGCCHKCRRPGAYSSLLQLVDIQGEVVACCKDVRELSHCFVDNNPTCILTDPP
jgi:hypothetical protein